MSLAAHDTAGVLTSEDLAAMQTILDEVCVERMIEKATPEREHMARRLIAIYDKITRDPGEVKVLLMRTPSR